MTAWRLMALRQLALPRTARFALALLTVFAGGLHLAAVADNGAQLDKGPNPAAAANNPAAPQYKRAVLIRFKGPITTLNEQYIYRKIDDAKARGADLLIVEIDSPGGLMQESLDIAKRLQGISWAHTVAFIPQRAISGGAIVALGCDEIVMAPHAQIGDAGPIYQNEFFMFREAEDKVRSFLVGEVRTLAEAKGRPTALAEAMVDKKAVVYKVRDTKTGEERLMTVHDLDASADPGRWEKLDLVQESDGDKYLQLSGRRAVELGLAQGTARDVDDLVKRYHLAERPIVLEWGWVDNTVMVLNHWLTSVLLIVVGLVALYIELSSPGISVGGLIAGLCFVLFFWSHFMGGTAGLLEIILFLAGVVFLGMEIFVIPGWGVAGVTGILLMISSLVLASQTFVIPSSGHDVETLTYGLAVVFGSIGGFLVSIMVFGRYMGSLPIFNRLILKPPSEADVVDAEEAEDGEVDAAKKSPLLGELFVPAVGDYGVADSPLRPAGKVRFGEEFVDVVTDGTFVEPGKQVRVIRIAGNRIVVREVEGTA